MMDFGRSVYKKNPDIRVDNSDVENRVFLRPPIENKRNAIEKVQNIRLSMNFGNISVKDLQRSLTDQLCEKEEHTEESPPEVVSTSGDSKPGFFPYENLTVAGSLSVSLLSKESSKTPDKEDQDKPKAYNKEKAKLNKSVTIKKPLLDDLKGVSVKDLSSGVIKLILKEKTEARLSNNDTDNLADSYELQHDHCLSCYDKNCTKIKDCPVVKCANKCGEASFHMCKQREHDEMCKYKIIKCINETLGCQMEMPRCKLAYHLKNCSEMQQPEKLASNLQLLKKKNRLSCGLTTTPSFHDYKNIHPHCLNCYDMNCLHQKECKMKNCPNKGCSMRLHACKIKDHKRICLFKLIPCINKEYGCQFRFSRIILTEHLRECSVMNHEALSLPPYNLFENKEQSHHCDRCFRSECTFPVKKKCDLTRCNCGVMLHLCKLEDHYENICPWYPMRCINWRSGCQMFLTRCMLTTHLLHCTAMNWNYRKEPQSALDNNNSHDKLELTPSIEYAGVKDNEDEHVYESLRKRKKKNKRNCKVM